MAITKEALEQFNWLTNKGNILGSKSEILGEPLLLESHVDFDYLTDAKKTIPNLQISDTKMVAIRSYKNRIVCLLKITLNSKVQSMFLIYDEKLNWISNISKETTSNAIDLPEIYDFKISRNGWMYGLTQGIKLNDSNDYSGKVCFFIFSDILEMLTIIQPNEIDDNSYFATIFDVETIVNSANQGSSVAIGNTNFNLVKDENNKYNFNQDFKDDMTFSFVLWSLQTQKSYVVQFSTDFQVVASTDSSWLINEEIILPTNRPFQDLDFNVVSNIDIATTNESGNKKLGNIFLSSTKKVSDNISTNYVWQPTTSPSVTRSVGLGNFGGQGSNFSTSDIRYSSSNGFGQPTTILKADLGNFYTKGQQADTKNNFELMKPYTVKIGSKNEVFGNMISDALNYYDNLQNPIINFVLHWGNNNDRNPTTINMSESTLRVLNSSNKADVSLQTRIIVDVLQPATIDGSSLYGKVAISFDSKIIIEIDNGNIEFPLKENVSYLQYANSINMQALERLFSTGVWGNSWNAFSDDDEYATGFVYSMFHAYLYPEGNTYRLWVMTNMQINASTTITAKVTGDRTVNDFTRNNSLLISMEKDDKNIINYSIRTVANNSSDATAPVFQDPYNVYVPLKNYSDGKYWIYHFNSELPNKIHNMEFNDIAATTFDSQIKYKASLLTMSEPLADKITVFINGVQINQSEITIINNQTVELNNVKINDKIRIIYKTEINSPEKLSLKTTTTGDDMHITSFQDVFAEQTGSFTTLIAGVADNSDISNSNTKIASEIYGFNLYDKKDSNIIYTDIAENVSPAIKNGNPIKLKHVIMVVQKDCIWWYGFGNTYGRYVKYQQIYNGSSPYTKLPYVNNNYFNSDRLNVNVDGEIGKTYFDRGWLDTVVSNNSILKTTIIENIDGVNEDANKFEIFGNTNNKIFTFDVDGTKTENDIFKVSFRLDVKFLENIVGGTMSENKTLTSVMTEIFSSGTTAISKLLPDLIEFKVDNFSSTIGYLQYHNVYDYMEYDPIDKVIKIKFSAYWPQFKKDGSPMPPVNWTDINFWLNGTTVPLTITVPELCKNKRIINVAFDINLSYDENGTPISFP